VKFQYVKDKWTLKDDTATIEVYTSRARYIPKTWWWSTFRRKRSSSNRTRITPALWEL
jgi:hypothetical protein